MLERFPIKGFGREKYFVRTSHILRDRDISLLPIFQDVPAHLLERITPDMIRFYGDGTIILAEGAPADNLLVLLGGQVRIFLNGIYLITRYPYTVLGEQAFINKTRRSATVIAQGIVEVLVLPCALVEQLMQNAAFVGNLLRFLSEKLTEATNERAYHFRNEALLFSEFRAHLSPEIANRLLATGLSYGHPRYIDAVILFADIRSFTETLVGMPAHEVANQLGPYFDAMVAVIQRYEGFVDKFIGDAVMAIWGFVPTEHDPVVQAFKCAQEMLHVAASMTFAGNSIRIGIGLNAGQVFIGNIGGEGKRQFTVLGLPVNLAARFESETKILGVPIVMGEDVYRRLPPCMQFLIAEHKDRPIKGAGLQTVYTYTPAMLADE
jgi:class 3 adenylate cyclase